MTGILSFARVFGYSSDSLVLKDGVIFVLDQEKLHILIGEKLRQLRKKHGFKQREIAERIGVERSTVSNVENGVQNATLSFVYKLCLALDEDFTEILPKLEEVKVMKVRTTNNNNEEISVKLSAAIEKARAS